MLRLRLMVVCQTADSGGEAIDYTIELWWVGVMASHCIIRTVRIRYSGIAICQGYDLIREKCGCMD